MKTVQTNNQNQAINNLQGGVEKAKANIAKLSANLLINPASALEWSHEHFYEAARIQVFTNVINKLNDKVDIDVIIEYCKKEVFQITMDLNRNANPCLKLMEQATLKAWAEAYSLILA